MASKLMIDIDHVDDETLKKILGTRKFVIFYFKLHIEEVLVFRTKHGYHIYISVEEDLDDETTLFIQTLLGDDFKRACFNYTRVKLKIANWNVLFTENEKYDIKLSKEIYSILKEGEEEEIVE
ncbi:MAG: hypothetical protein QXS21_05500 [Thermoproteota archaeon]